MKASERLEDIQNIIDRVRAVLAQCYPHIRSMKIEGDDIISYDNINDVDHDLETVDYILNDLEEKMSWYIREAEDREERKERGEDI